MAKTVSMQDEGRDLASDVKSAAEVLRSGGIVILPTETVYGVAGVLTHQGALARLRNLKEGPGGPLTIHLANREQAAEYLGELSDFAKRLMQKVWPGPVGLIFDVEPLRQREVAERLGVAVTELYNSGTMTLRCPDHPVTLGLLSEVSPVVLTQAPTTSGATALKVSDIAEAVLKAVDLTIDGGATRFSKPSTLLKVRKNDYDIVRAGVFDRRIIDRMLKTTILFVCSGNTCRSPMAMALARKVLAQKLNTTVDKLDEKGVAVISAGSFASAGARATPQAVEAVATMNADLTSHRSRPLSVELIHSADRIYTMGRSHRAAVLSMVPSAAEKTVLLDPSGADIEDPIGSNVTVYKSLAADLEKLITRRFEESPVV